MTLRETPDTTPPSNTEETQEPSNLDSAKNNDPSPDGEDEDLDFVVTEAHDASSELVGGVKIPEAESLGIETPAELMEAKTGALRDWADSPIGTSDVLVGESAPPPPPEPENVFEQTAKLAPGRDNLDAEEPHRSLERLSEQQVQEISQRMRVKSERPNYLSDEEKRQLMTAIHDEPTTGYEVTDEHHTSSRGTGFNNEPIVPPKRHKDVQPVISPSDLPSESPKIAKRLRGVAFFAKGYIQVTGQQELHEGDELVISGREYVLRKKRISSKVIAIAVTAIAAVVVFTLGTLFSPNADIGDGRVVGIVLDEDSRPVLTGGQVRFPELGRSFDINGQGLFRTDRLDAGSYKLEFVVNRQVAASDYATVVDDNITTVVLKPAPPEASPVVAQAPPSALPIASPVPRSVQATENRAEPAAARSQANNRSTQTAATTPSYAKLTLAANVDNAKLSIDGSVIGAGNLTYTKLSPGRHSYSVARDGYQTATGSVDLKAGEISTLELTLLPSAGPAKPSRNAEQDLYQSALSAAERGDTQTALGELTRAIELNPSYADAYAKRADLNFQTRNNSAARDDFVRAAEIYQMRNDNSQALSAYQSALRIDAKSIPAYLGRGSLYLARNEAIAAIADFDMVIRLDKRNVDGYLGLGRARYNQGNFDKATKHFKDARSLEPNNPVIHQYLMLSHFGMGEFKEVQKDYDKFTGCATEAQIQQIKKDQRFAPVLRVLAN